MIVVSHQPLTERRGRRRRRWRCSTPIAHVVAALAGDSHHNRIVAATHARPAATGSCRPRRWPTIPSRRACCACARRAGGGTVLETWMLDTAPDPLADTARELAYLDAQGGRPQHEAGTRLDRNVRLYLR